MMLREAWICVAMQWLLKWNVCKQLLWGSLTYHLSAQWKNMMYSIYVKITWKDIHQVPSWSWCQTLQLSDSQALPTVVTGRPHPRGDGVPAEGSLLAQSRFGQQRCKLWHCAGPSPAAPDRYQWPGLRTSRRKRQWLQSFYLCFIYVCTGMVTFLILHEDSLHQS